MGLVPLVFYCSDCGSDTSLFNYVVLVQVQVFGKFNFPVMDFTAFKKSNNNSLSKHLYSLLIANK